MCYTRSEYAFYRPSAQVVITKIICVLLSRKKEHRVATAGISVGVRSRENRREYTHMHTRGVPTQTFMPCLRGALGIGFPFIQQAQAAVLGKSLGNTPPHPYTHLTRTAVRVFIRSRLVFPKRTNAQTERHQPTDLLLESILFFHQATR